MQSDVHESSAGTDGDHFAEGGKSHVRVNVRDGIDRLVKDCDAERAANQYAHASECKPYHTNGRQFERVPITVRSTRKSQKAENRAPGPNQLRCSNRPTRADPSITTTDEASMWFSP